MYSEQNLRNSLKVVEYSVIAFLYITSIYLFYCGFSANDYRKVIINLAYAFTLLKILVMYVVLIGLTIIYSFIKVDNIYIFDNILSICQFYFSTALVMFFDIYRGKRVNWMIIMYQCYLVGVALILLYLRRIGMQQVIVQDAPVSSRTRSKVQLFM